MVHSRPGGLSGAGRACNAIHATARESREREREGCMWEREKLDSVSHVHMHGLKHAFKHTAVLVAGSGGGGVKRHRG